MDKKPVYKLPKGTTMTNEQYRQLLKETYPEAGIFPLEQYVSPQATLLHCCKFCNTTWYDQPHNLINLSHTDLRHVCDQPLYFRLGHGAKKNVTVLKSARIDQNEEEIEKLATALQLIEVGYSLEEVTDYLEIKPAIVCKWANILGVVSKNKLKREVKSPKTKRPTNHKSNDNYQYVEVDTRRSEKLTESGLRTQEEKRKLIRELLSTAKEVSDLLAEQEFTKLYEDEKRERF